MLGLLYLVFEESILTQTAPDKAALASSQADVLSRVILGVQVGLVALAMLVTRSSVASLQAKQGLPLGTQIVGWFTLSKSRSLSPSFVFSVRPSLVRWYLVTFPTGHRYNNLSLASGLAVTDGLYSLRSTLQPFAHTRLYRLLAVRPYRRHHLAWHQFTWEKPEIETIV